MRRMKVEAAKYEAGRLTLTVSDAAEAARFAFRFESGEYEIVKAKKRRSLDANAYAWVLIDKLAEALRMTKTEVYQKELRELGGNMETGVFERTAALEMKRIWERNGLGWQAEIEESKTSPHVCVVYMYYGSSAFDTKEMSRFIENLITEAKALGIETLPPDKLSALLEAWDGK